MIDVNQSITTICNSAIVACGAQVIQSIDDQSDVAQACRSNYFNAFRACLRSHPWNFARIWTGLAQLQALPVYLRIKPNPNYQGDIIFSAMYQLPTDCVRVFRAGPYNYNFRIVGQTLFTDAPTQAAPLGNFIGAEPGVGVPPITNLFSGQQIGIEYISDTVDPTQWDAGFTEALIAKLAAQLAWPLVANLQLKKSLEDEFTVKLQEAWYADGAEQYNDELYNDVLTNVRQQLGDGAWW